MVSISQRGDDAMPVIGAKRPLVLLPEGEGQDEGER